MINYDIKCFNCKKSEPDPEYGYTCSIEEWDYFPKAYAIKNQKFYKCPFYRIDKDFLRKQLDDFIKRVERESVIE